MASNQDMQRLIVSLEAQTRQFTNALNKANGVANSRTRQIERRFERLNRSVSRSMNAAGRSLTRGLAVLAGGLAVREAVQTADAWTEAGNALAATAQTIGRSVASLDDLVEVATETRTAFDGVVNLYARMERAGASLGRSQEEMLRTTELVAKSFVAGGATAEEQRSAILQLSQAIASGALQGDELRAIRESAPLVAQAIADAMGVSIGELRDLGAQGRITADIIIDAMLRSGQQIERQFDATRMTVGQAMNNLRTAALQAVGGMDDVSGATESVARRIDELATTIRDNQEGLSKFANGLADIAAFGISAAASIANVADAITDDLAEAIARFNGLPIESPPSQDDQLNSVRRARDLLQEGDVVRVGQLRETLGQGFVGDDAINRILAQGGLSPYDVRSTIVSRGARAALTEYLTEYANLLAEQAAFEVEDAAPERVPTPRQSPRRGRVESGPSQDEIRARENLRIELELSLARLRNDTEAVRAAEDRLELAKRIADYEQAGYEGADARRRAEADQAQLAEAREAAQAREVRLLQEAAALQAAEAAEDQQAAEALERQADLRDRINQYRQAGLAPERATQQAIDDIHRIEQARLETRRRMLADAQMEHRITLAQLAGQRDIERSLTMQQEIVRRTREYRNLGEPDPQARAEREVNAEESARRYGEARDIFARSFSDGIRAALSGDLRNFLSNSFGSIADEAFQRLGEQLFETLFEAPADLAKAGAEGVAQGTAAGTQITGAMVAGGASAASSIGSAMTAAGAAAAAQIAAAMQAGGGGGAIGAIAKLAGAGSGGLPLKIPGKALGGPVRAGQPYVVGETGKELFVPDVPGRIAPRIPSGGIGRQNAMPRELKVRLMVTEDEMFATRVQQISADVVGESIPVTVDLARQATSADLATYRRNKL